MSRAEGRVVREVVLLEDFNQRIDGVPAALPPPRLPGTVKYIVSAYENSEWPDPRWLDEGCFDNAAWAIGCAEGIIDRSLASLHSPGMSAENLRLGYLCYGEVPSIFNEEELHFDPYAYVRRRIREMTGEMDWRREPGP
jgi:hypothetical protein